MNVLLKSVSSFYLIGSLYASRSLYAFRIGCVRMHCRWRHQPDRNADWPISGWGSSATRRRSASSRRPPRRSSTTPGWSESWLGLKFSKVMVSRLYCFYALLKTKSASDLFHGKLGRFTSFKLETFSTTPLERLNKKTLSVPKSFSNLNLPLSFLC